MIVNKTVSTKVTLTKAASDEASSNTYPVQVAGKTEDFQLDGKVDDFVPSHQVGDVRNLDEAAQLIQNPLIQRRLDSIKTSNSLGGKVDLGHQGVWDVYGHFGTFSISRLEPKDGHRHRVEFSSRHLSIYNESNVGGDVVKQQVVGDYNSRTGEYTLREERLTVDATA